MEDGEERGGRGEGSRWRGIGGGTSMSISNVFARQSTPFPIAKCLAIGIVAHICMLEWRLCSNSVQKLQFGCQPLPPV